MGEWIVYLEKIVLVGSFFLEKKWADETCCIFLIFATWNGDDILINRFQKNDLLLNSVKINKRITDFSNVYFK